MNATWRKNGLVYLLIIVAVAVLFYSMSQSSERPAERNLTEIASLIKEGKVAKVVVSGDQIEVTTSDKQSFRRAERGQRQPDEHAGQVGRDGGTLVEHRVQGRPAG